MKQGDKAWLAMFAGIVVYELAAEDLLSDATERYWQAHPWLTRAVIAAVAGHLAGLVPSDIDMLSSKNLVHRWAFTHYPLVRLDRRARMAARLVVDVDLG